jgi:hypothetical protein
MEEINKRTLIEALSSLPEHDPPGNLWEAIESELEEKAESTFSRQELRELPEYAPPPEVWEKIESKVGENARIVPLRVRRVLAVAASLALLFAAYWTMNQAPISGSAETGDFTLSYTTETVDEMLFEHDWNEDESAFEEFKQLCEAKKYICEHPEFQVLKSDLEELTEAKEAVQEAIGSYGTDPELVLQIKEIELERTDVLKKMMVMLI